MKSNLLGLRRELVGVAVGLAAGYVLFGTRENSFPMMNQAKAQVAAAPAAAVREAVVWEYKTTSTDVASLQTALTALGADGWEAISIANLDAIVETGPDGKPHVTCQRFEVTAKRKSR